ncbi:MAG: TraR/DksA family transcriptional regulator [Gammaproteobacteria bacterium]|nr:TraR/DksA family transcriptional regulator [Gammaproteobacteria bacterium]
MQNTEAFKQKLINLRREVTQRMRSIDRDIRHEDLSADWNEQATERENDEVLESLGNAADRELTHINAALERIENDTYFFCEDCGSGIPAARLELLPFSTLCISCAEDLEYRSTIPNNDNSIGNDH